MRIARVFPTKTSMTPDDQDVYFAEPYLWKPDYDEVHISCTFTWDRKRAYELYDAWKSAYNCPVKIGGVAIDGESDQPFISGMYLKNGITITSRGCPNNCSFCVVKNDFIEFDDFPEGNIIQDNNILACSDDHWRKVCKMLKGQRRIEFKGGLEARRVTAKRAEDLRGLKIKSLWLACDSDSAIEPVRNAVGILRKAGFPKSSLLCYVLIGKEEQRLRAIREMDVMPFAQLYMEYNDTRTEYTKEMKKYQRLMSRPAVTRNIFKTLA